LLSTGSTLLTAATESRAVSNACRGESSVANETVVDDAENMAQLICSSILACSMDVRSIVMTRIVFCGSDCISEGRPKMPQGDTYQMAANCRLQQVRSERYAGRQTRSCLHLRDGVAVKANNGDTCSHGRRRFPLLSLCGLAVHSLRLYRFVRHATALNRS
jgi:hypothetical protein